MVELDMPLLSDHHLLVVSAAHNNWVPDTVRGAVVAGNVTDLLGGALADYVLLRHLLPNIEQTNCKQYHTIINENPGSVAVGECRC